jgi:hypothetical protein
MSPSSDGTYSVGPNRSSLCLVLNRTMGIMSTIVIVILIYHRHKPIDSINLLGS